jgi:hypothetical protein
MLEVEAIPQSLVSVMFYIRSLLLVGSLDLRPSKVRVIPVCFRVAKMCLCQVSPAKGQPEALDLFFLGFIVDKSVFD